MKSQQNTLFGIAIQPYTQSDILDKIRKYTHGTDEYLHIVSLNPENMVIADDNEEFKRVIAKSKLKIIDGVGLVLASKMLNVDIGERLTGVDLMYKCLKHASKRSLRVMLIGGEEKIADNVIKCQKQQFSKAKFISERGITDIKNPKRSEEEKVLRIVADYKPHFLFTAFGSPFQELWIDKHRANLKGVVCMGVGGSFDFLSGKIPRAPVFLRKMGLEWLFRLILQPWRIKRQTRLLKFAWLTVKEVLRRCKCPMFSGT